MRVVVCGTILTACSPSVDTVATVKSPSGLVEAVLEETNGGATTDFGYEVNLKGVSSEQRAVRVAKLYGAIRNESASGVNLVWLSNQVLEIQYWEAERAEIEQASIAVNGQRISVQLKAGVLDKSAPAGGMDYNLHPDKYPRH